MPPYSISKQAIALLISLVLAYAAAAIGGLATFNAEGFYDELTRPDWAPPGWIFGPVWSALYTLMAIAAWLVWREAGKDGRRAALALYSAQLAANALWSWLFFAWKQGALAFAEILVLWILIVFTIFAFRKLRPLAAALLLPYLAWVSFAAALAFATWRLNPSALG